LSPFLFEIARLRVIFARGSLLRAANELHAMGLQRALLIANPSHRRQAQMLADLLGERCVGTYDNIVQHVPIEVATAASAHARELGADSCIAIGGGSAIGLAKAIALETSLPFIAIPTTYSGSEMTSVWGLTANGVKRTGRDPRVQARAVIYDAELFTSLPPGIAGPSGVNAMAHAVEGLYAENANPIISTLAQESVRAIATGLPRVCRQADDLSAQEHVLYGSCLAGIVLNSVGMSLHHKLCHTLGGTFNLPHAETHAVILPYAAAFNLVAATDANTRLQAALGSEDVGRALHAFARAVGAPRSLQELGLKADDLDRAAELATLTPYPNPRPLTRESIRALLEQAYQGAVPSTGGI
jgi:maleylacetate reductase